VFLSPAAKFDQYKADLLKVAYARTALALCLMQLFAGWLTQLDPYPAVINIGTNFAAATKAELTVVNYTDSPIYHCNSFIKSSARLTCTRITLTLMYKLQQEENSMF
jgi:hypothetical protein